jgi:hypothetical protein
MDNVILRCGDILLINNYYGDGAFIIEEKKPRGIRLQPLTSGYAPEFYTGEQIAELLRLGKLTKAISA